MTFNFPKILSDVPSEFDTIDSWCDIDDTAIVARQNKTCFGAFRGTVSVNPLDQAQLFDCRMTDFRNCRVRDGFKRGYKASYYLHFRKAIAECMEHANELVLTGFSQGGSVAVVASIDLKDYHPVVITFGAVRTLEHPCEQHLNSSRHFRFINVGLTDEKEIAYDYWPNVFTKQATHVGHAFLMDSTSASNQGVYLGLDNDSTRTPKSRDVHQYDRYHDSLKNLLVTTNTTTCDAIVLSGWEDGHFCTEHDECRNKAFCVNGICKAALVLQDGELCSEDSDCHSGTCTKQWWRIFEEKRCTVGS
jgi:hypothetical protein